MKLLKLTLLSCATLLSVSAANAATVGSEVNVRLQTDSGKELSFFPVSDTGATKRVYAEAVENEQYKIRITNPTPHRVGVVVAVDGRNILSGQASTLLSTEQMYILEPFAAGEYKGWQTSKSAVNRFVFTTEESSYAAAFEDESAMGVIAVAVFPEDVPIHRPMLEEAGQEPLGSMERRSKAVVPSSRTADASVNKLESAGTGYGRREKSAVTVVEFKAVPTPVEKLFIKYEWRKTLCKKGVISCHPSRDNRFWNDDDADRQFAPPPPPPPKRF